MKKIIGVVVILVVTVVLVLGTTGILEKISSSKTYTSEEVLEESTEKLSELKENANKLKDLENSVGSFGKLK